MKISYAPFTLNRTSRSKQGLNRFDSKTLRSRLESGKQNIRSGIYLRFENGSFKGHVEVLPWVVLGDPPVDFVLENLQDKQFKNLAIKNLFDLAYFDNSLRNYSSLNPVAVHGYGFEGGDVGSKPNQTKFSHIKLKLCGELQKDLVLVKETILRSPDSLLRLDCNEGYNLETFRRFEMALKPNIEFIDYIEDPMPEDFNWKSDKLILKEKFAKDFQVRCSNSVGISRAGIDVVKPARGIRFALENAKERKLSSKRLGCKKRIIISSNMGGRLDLWHSYALASLIDGEHQEVHGIDTTWAYLETSKFFEHRNHSVFPRGRAVSEMYRELDDLKWEKLIEY